MNIDWRYIVEDDIEKLRIWKNENKQSFFLKDDISKEQQEEWFKGYTERNNQSKDFILMIQYDNNDVGCIGYRVENNRIDIYNLMLGDKGFEGKKIISTASKKLWQFLKDNYDMDITAKVLLSNPETINWYLKNNWSLVVTFYDYIILRYEAK